MVNEDDAEWQRRREHRRAGVRHVQNTEYFRRASAVGLAVQGPDAEDRRVSKRSWERSMQEWISAIKALLDEQ